MCPGFSYTLECYTVVKKSKAELMEKKHAAEQKKMHKNV